MWPESNEYSERHFINKVGTNGWSEFKYPDYTSDDVRYRVNSVVVMQVTSDKRYTFSAFEVIGEQISRPKMNNKLEYFIDDPRIRKYYSMIEFPTDDINKELEGPGVLWNEDFCTLIGLSPSKILRERLIGENRLLDGDFMPPDIQLPYEDVIYIPQDLVPRLEQLV